MAFIRNVDNLIEGLNNKFFTEARARAAVAPDIAVEQQRAQAAEAAEQSARQSADSQLQSNINAEQSARQSADSALSGRLDVVEGTGNGSIKKSLQDAKDYADLKVTNLINGAPGALDTLKEIADQLANDESAVGALTNTVASNLAEAKSYADSKVSQEVSDRQQAVSSEQSARQSADSALGLRIDGVQGDLSSEVSARQSAISSEQSARQSADQALGGRIAVLEQDPTTKSYVDGINGALDSRLDMLEADPTTKSYVDGVKSNLQGQITQEISDRQSAMSSEQQRAEGAEQALDGRLDVLEQDPTTKSYVDSKVVMLEGEISQEVSDRQAAVSQEASARHIEVEAEKSRAMGVEAGLQSAIDQEIGDRQAAISSEASSRSSADAAEMSARQSADSALSNRIGILEQDPTTKTYVDGIKVDLQGKIDQEISDRQSDVNAEESRAMSAESGLSARIGVLEQDPTTKTYVDSKVNQEKSERQGDVSGLNLRLVVLEQDPTTKSYVDGKISGLINGAPQALDTLKEIADQLSNDESVVGALTNTVASNLQAAKDYADSKVSAEALLRSSADSAEQSRAMGVESGLRSDLNSEISNRQSADSAEQSARQSADTALSGRISVLEADPVTKAYVNSGLSGKVDVTPNYDIKPSVYSGGTKSANFAINLAQGAKQKFVLGASVTVTFSNPVSGADYLLELVQDGTGGRQITWPSVQWFNGVAPTLSGANKIDFVHLFYDGSSYYGSYQLADVVFATSSDLSSQIASEASTRASADTTLQTNINNLFSTKSTTNLAEGTNLYYTQARFDSAFGAKSTSNLAEGSNLYYTTARVQTDAAKRDLSNLTSPVALNQSMLFGSDGVSDIGANGASRPNNVYVKGTVTSGIVIAANGITMSGGQTVKYSAKSGNYTMTTSDYLIAVTDVSVSRIMTLPAVANTGAVFIVKDQSGVASQSNYIQIAPQGGKTLDGQADYKIQVPYESVMIVYNGSNWIII